MTTQAHLNPTGRILCSAQRFFETLSLYHLNRNLPTFLIFIGMIPTRLFGFACAPTLAIHSFLYNTFIFALQLFRSSTSPLIWTLPGHSPLDVQNPTFVRIWLKNVRRFELNCPLLSLKPQALYRDLHFTKARAEP